MKILQTNFLNYPRQSYQIAPYRKQENNQDVFVKSNSVAFTGNEVNENPYQQVLQNPTLVQKVMELVTTAATILVGKAAGIGFKPDEKTINVDKICEEVREENNEKNQEIEVYKQKIEQLEQENSNLKQLLEKKEQKENTFQNIDNPTPESEDNTDETDSVPQEQDLPQEELIENTETTQTPEYVFVFPKKRAGILSKSQKELKEITSQLTLDQELGDKLTQICTELLQNGSHNIEGQITDNKDITDELVKNLSSCTIETLPQIIDEFYTKCELTNKENSETQKDLTEQNEIQNTTISAQEKPSVEIFETEKPVLPGVTIKGKIDLDCIKERGKRTAASRKKEAQNDIITEKKKRPRITKPVISNPEKDFSTISTLEVKNENTKSSIFTIPGTADKNVMLNLKRLLLQFEHQIEKEDSNPRYQCGKALSLNIDDNAIMKELRDHDYAHIDKNNITDIKDAINSDPRFHEMFTLHAAMRLIDRFADFNSTESLDIQCHNILDKLDQVLQKSFKEGLEVRRYKDDNGRIGLRLFVTEDIYDNETRAVFGSYPFRLGICENQPDSTYYNKRNKQPLICTIFTKGI